MNIRYFFWAVLAAVLVSSCSDNSTEPQEFVSKRGSVRFNIDKQTVPENVVYVKAYLSRNNFDTLKASLNIDSDSTANLTFENIAVGKWLLKVDALNGENKLLYTGMGEVEIIENSTVQAFLELLPVSSGVGTITIDITWENYKTLILQPGPANGKDAYINFPQTTLVFSYKEYLIIHAGEPLESGYRQIHRTVMDFDLSSIPESSLILKAELSLYWGGGSYGAPEWAKYHYGSNAFVIKRITSTWDKETVNWSNQPAISNEDSVYVPPSQSSAQSYQIDVKNLIQRYVSSPETSKGFLFKLADENAGGGVVFRSSENSDSYLRPTLTIKYR